MITIFNRREVLLTFSMKQQADARSSLASNDIKYIYKVFNTSTHNGSRARTGTYGKDMMMAYEYTIYVHKKDYDRANAIVNGTYEQRVVG